jgi:opacity protein-like surface antigen
MAGDSVAESLSPATTDQEMTQSIFGAPYIRFGRKNSDSLLPGYTIGTSSYLHRFTSDFDKSQLGDVSVDEFSLWTPIAAFNKDEFHLFAWIGYDALKYNVGNNSIPNLLTEHTLQSVSMPILFLHDVSEQWLWGALVMPTYAGAQSSSDNFAISLAAGAGYTYNPDLTVFAGVYYYNGFGDDLIIPGVAFIWRPAPRWEVYLLPPIGGITYSVTDRFLIGLAGQYDSPSWHVKSDKLGPDRDISVSGLRIGLKAEYHLGSYFWAYANGGIAVGQTMEIENSDNDTLQKSDIDASPFIQIGLNVRF